MALAVALDNPVLWGVVFFLVFVVEVLVVVNLRGKPSTQYERPSQEAVLEEGEELTDVLSRFVDDEHGNRIGETVGMDGDLVIVKEAEKADYKAIPRSLMVREGEVFRVQPGVPWEEADQKGREWKERQHRLVQYSTEELPEDERDRPY